ncbi:MAG: ABC transporter permease subunit [Chloroflexota bacterium]|nr:ABC transporter permease subunit [Chloroflexota bacterium]
MNVAQENFRQNQTTLDKPKCSALDHVRQNSTLYLMAIPAVLSIIVFSYLPLFGLSIAFLDFSPFRGILGSEWVGTANFADAFNNPFFWAALRNSFIISTLKLMITFPSAVILALLLNEVRKRWLKVVIQTSTMLPFLVSWVVAGAMFRAILGTDGLVNSVGTSLFNTDPIAFLSDPQPFRWVLILQDTWKYAGYFAVLYLAAMATIDPNLYEAAEVDGASRWQQTVHVTLPGISNTMITILLISVGYLVAAGFEQVYVMYNVSVYETADILETFTLRLALSQGNYGLATAVGLVQGAISLTLVLIVHFTAKRLGRGGLF